MKFDNITDIYLIISVLVPGFIFCACLSKFCPQREENNKEIVLLRFFTASAINYAFCSPYIYLLITGDLTKSSGIAAFLWFLIIFCAPVILALITAKILQKGLIDILARWLGLRYINPIPTGWDWKFSQIEPCYLLITLKDGTQIAGYFGLLSFTSSIQEHKDIYLEKAYTVSVNKPWMPVANSNGVYVDGEQIAFIEFFE